MKTRMQVEARLRHLAEVIAALEHETDHTARLLLLLARHEQQVLAWVLGVPA